MPTDKPRFTITFDVETDHAIEAYWHRRHLRSKNEAINELLQIALDKRNLISNLTAQEEQLLNRYRELPGVGKAIIDTGITAGVMYVNEHYPNRNLFSTADENMIPGESLVDALERLAPHIASPDDEAKSG